MEGKFSCKFGETADCGTLWHLSHTLPQKCDPFPRRLRRRSRQLPQNHGVSRAIPETIDIVGTLRANPSGTPRRGALRSMSSAATNESRFRTWQAGRAKKAANVDIDRRANICRQRRPRRRGSPWRTGLPDQQRDARCRYRRSAISRPDRPWSASLGATCVAYASSPMQHHQVLRRRPRARAPT